MAYLGQFDKIAQMAEIHRSAFFLSTTIPYIIKKSIFCYTDFYNASFAFGELLDVYGQWAAALPDALVWQIVYFVSSYLIIGLGIALSNRCGLPIIPIGLFPGNFRKLQDLIMQTNQF